MKYVVPRKPNGGKVDAVSSESVPYWQVPIKERRDFKGNWFNKLIADNITPFKRGFDVGATVDNNDLIRLSNKKVSGELNNSQVTDSLRLYIKDRKTKEPLNKVKPFRPSNINASKDALYLHQGLPQKYSSFSMSRYKPSISSKDETYYSLRGEAKDEIINDLFKGKNKDFLENDDKIRHVKNTTIGQAALRNFKYSKGRDNNGEYISYYDKNDYHNFLDKVGKPFEIYDRIYVDKDSTGNYIPKNNKDMKYAIPNKKYGGKVPKHMLGAIIGAANMGLGIVNSIKAKRQQEEMEQLARNNRTASLLNEDRIVLDEYPTEGNNISGFYKEGGKLTTPYNTKGGIVLPISNSMDVVKGNTHENSKIDNTTGVKLINNGQPIAEVEDEEVIKDDVKVFSDTLKYRGNRTYADEAKIIGNKLAKVDKTLNNPISNRRSKNSAKLNKRNLESKGDNLFIHQEEMKTKKGINSTFPKGELGLNIANLATNTLLNRGTNMIGDVNAFGRLSVPSYMTSISTPNFNNNNTTTLNKVNNSNNDNDSNFDLNNVTPFIDNIGNAILTSMTPKQSFPMLARPRKLKTEYNVNPQLQEVTDIVNQITKGIDEGTSNSNVATQRNTSTRLAGVKQKNNILAQKENIETQLENQQVLNNQNIEAQNLAKIDNYNNNNLIRSYNVQGRVSSNLANMSEDINRDQQAKSIEDYQNKQLDVISKTYDVNGTSLRALASIYLSKDSNGNYIYPEEAKKFLSQYPQYK